MPDDVYDPDIPTPAEAVDDPPDDKVCGYPVDRTPEDWPG